MIVKNIPIYDGNLIHKRFAYKFFRDRTLPIGNIIAFRAPMHVEAEGMIDTEDILNNDFGAVSFQRLFNTQIANILTTIINKPIEVDGDDLIVHAEHTQHGIVQPKGKSSVSITHLVNGAALGHTAINIVAGKKAPAFAYSTNMTHEQVNDFMQKVVETFYKMTDDIFIATSKVI